MNIRRTLTVVVVGMTLSVPASFAQTTPLRFAQRRDVGREIQLQPNQRAAIQALGPICDAQCQALVSQNFTDIDDDARLAYGALPAEVQDQIVSDQQSAVREDVEMTAIDDVLANPQMDRFRELWAQFQGASSLTSGFVSDALGLSDSQRSELQDLQSAANQLTNECLSNSGISQQQQAAIIQNINNGVIDQSINILENGQLQIFLELCGQPCEFDSTEDVDQQPEQGEGSDSGAEPTDINNEGAEPDDGLNQTGDSNSGGDDSTPTENAAQGSATRRNLEGSSNRNATNRNVTNTANRGRSSINQGQRGSRPQRGTAGSANRNSRVTSRASSRTSSQSPGNRIRSNPSQNSNNRSASGNALPTAKKR